MPGFAEVHTERQRVTGSFIDSGRRVRGTVGVTSAGRSGLAWHSSVTFSARAK